MSRFVYLRDVVSLTLDPTRCKGCGTCTKVCPHAVLSLESGKARIGDRDTCMECGACALNCRRAALSVRSGVGCANAIIKGALRGGGPTCGCSCEPTAPTSASGGDCC